MCFKGSTAQNDSQWSWLMNWRKLAFWLCVQKWSVHLKVQFLRIWWGNLNKQRNNSHKKRVWVRQSPPLSTYQEKRDIVSNDQGHQRERHLTWGLLKRFRTCMVAQIFWKFINQGFNLLICKRNARRIKIHKVRKCWCCVNFCWLRQRDS